MPASSDTEGKIFSANGFSAALPRRRFFQTAGWLAGALYSSHWSWAALPRRRPVDSALGPDRSKHIVRGSDLVNIRVTLDGAVFDGKCNLDGWKVILTGARPTVTFTFPPQHVLEQRYPAEQETKDWSKYEYGYSGESEIVVALPQTKPERYHRATDFLRLLTTQPTLLATKIEFPAGLVLTPFLPTTWPNFSRHREFDRLPKFNFGMELENRFQLELWHAAMRLDQPRWSFPYPCTSHAVWITTPADLDPAAIRDAVAKGPIPAERQPGGVMIPVDTRQVSYDPEVLVKKHSEWMKLIKLGVADRNSVLRFDHLALTAFGANGAFSYRQPLSNADSVNPLLEWTQRTLLGRDAFVRVVSLAYLLPFQHRAAQIEIIERKFGPARDDPAKRVALLEKKHFVVVLEPTRYFDGAGSETADAKADQAGRHVAFSRVTIETVATPALDKYSGWLHATGASPGRAFEFKLSGTLPDGSTQQSTMALFLVEELPEAGALPAAYTAPEHATDRVWRQQGGAGGFVPRASAALATTRDADPALLKQIVDVPPDGLRGSPVGKKFIGIMGVPPPAGETEDVARVRVATGINTFLEAAEARIDTAQVHFRVELKSLLTAAGIPTLRKLVADLAPLMNPEALTQRWEAAFVVIIRGTPLSTQNLEDLAAHIAREIMEVVAFVSEFLRQAEDWGREIASQLAIINAVNVAPAKELATAVSALIANGVNGLSASGNRLEKKELQELKDEARTKFEAFSALDLSVYPALPPNASSRVQQLYAQLEQAVLRLPAKAPFEILTSWSADVFGVRDPLADWRKGTDALTSELMRVGDDDFRRRCLRLLNVPLPLRAAAGRFPEGVARACVANLNADGHALIRRHLMAELGVDLESIAPSSMYSEWVRKEHARLAAAMADVAREMQETAGRFAVAASAEVLKEITTSLKTQCSLAEDALKDLAKPAEKLEEFVGMLHPDFDSELQVGLTEFNGQITKLKTAVTGASLATLTQQVSEAQQALKEAGAPLAKIAGTAQLIPLAAPELRISEIEFGLAQIDPRNLRLANYPSWVKAKVVIPEVAGMSAVANDLFIAPIAQFRDEGFRRVKQGIGEARGACMDAYAQLADVQKSAKDLGAGVATLQAQFAGLSREAGAMVAKNAAQVVALAAGPLLDGLPTEMPKGMGELLGDMNLLGVIPIQDLIGAGNVMRDMPQAVNRRLADGHEIKMDMIQPVSEVNLGYLQFMPRGSTNFVLNHTTRVQLVNGKPVTTVLTEGRIDKPFNIVLGKVVVVSFEGVQFRSANGGGMELTSQLTLPKPVQFAGELAFVAQLEALFSQASAMLPEISGEHIVLRKRVELPPVSLGGFSLSNMSLNVGLGVPLGRRPMFYEFSFCTAQEKFLLSVSGYSGAGYIALRIDSKGGKELEGAMGFGGSLAFNVGVAQGEIAIIAGGAIKTSSITHESSISMFLQAWGRLRVLSIITVSVDLYIALIYQRKQGEQILFGTATLTVKVKVLCTSKSVSFQFKQEFAGSKPDRAEPPEVKQGVPPAAIAGSRRSLLPKRPLHSAVIDVSVREVPASTAPTASIPATADGSAAPEIPAKPVPPPPKPDFQSTYQSIYANAAGFEEYLKAFRF